MHPAALENFKREIGAIPRSDLYGALRVLDMGGQDINGTVHDALRRAMSSFISLDVLDIEAGAGVTIVGDARRVDWWDEIPYDVVISTEMLEHLHRWQNSIPVVWRVLRPGGWFIGTCASSGRPPHGATGEPLPGPAEHYQNVDATKLIDVLRHYAFDRINVGYEMNGDPTTHDLHWRARKAVW